MAAEPALAGFMFATVLSHDRLEDSVCHRIAQRLGHADVDAGLLIQTFQDVLAKQDNLGAVFRADLSAVLDRDPACTRYSSRCSTSKGFMRSPRIASLMSFGGRGGAISRSICRASRRAFLPSTSIRRRALVGG